MDKEKLAKIKDYYKDGLTIIGLNDLEVASKAGSFFKKDLLDYLIDILAGDEIDPTIINAFSPIINKTEHIDYLLKSNVSIEELKLARVYSIVQYLEELSDKHHLPKSLGKIGYLSKLRNLVNVDDDKTRIVSVIEEAKEPIIIYSSGYSNLKREIAFDGVSDPKDYAYTLKKVNSKKILNGVVRGVEKNFYSILSINDKSDIYVINVPIPDTIKEVKNLVISFNEALYNLCKEYSLTYIDRTVTDNTMDSLTKKIADAIYENKIISPKVQTREYSDYSYNSKGALGVMDETLYSWRVTKRSAIEKEGYEQEHILEVAKSYKDEYDVFDKVHKVLTKRDRKYRPRLG